MTNLFTDILDHPQIFGKQLKTLRLSLEFTIEFVASETGLSKSFISLVESGKRNINLIDLQKLLRVYRYSVIRFFSDTADAVEGKKYNPERNVQTEEHSILIEGSRNPGKHHLILKRPVCNKEDLAILNLFLPAGVEYPKDYFSCDAVIRGVVLSGEMLVHFQDDEILIKEGEEFSFNGERQHVFRNHKKENLSALLIIQYPYF